MSCTSLEIRREPIEAAHVCFPVRLSKPAGWCTAHIPGVYRLTRIPAQALDYFTHPTLYDTEATQLELEGSGITAPTLLEYIDTLVAFVEEHPEIGSAAMA